MSDLMLGDGGSVHSLAGPGETEAKLGPWPEETVIPASRRWVAALPSVVVAAVNVSATPVRPLEPLPAPCVDDTCGAGQCHGQLLCQPPWVPWF